MLYYLNNFIYNGNKLNGTEFMLYIKTKKGFAIMDLSCETLDYYINDILMLKIEYIGNIILSITTYKSSKSRKHLFFVLHIENNILQCTGYELNIYNKYSFIIYKIYNNKVHIKSLITYKKSNNLSI